MIWSEKPQLCEQPAVLNFQSLEGEWSQVEAIFLCMCV